ncbi:hypothetical protein ACXAUS_004012 [Clostridium sporogenes]
MNFKGDKMKSIFILELKRAIINLRFVLAIVIGIYLCYYGLTDYYQFAVHDFHDNVVNAYKAWFTALGFGDRSFFIYAVPIICTLPFSYSYIEDKNSGYLRSILYRVEYKKYFRSKLLVNSIVGGLTLFIPVVFIFIVCAIKYSVGLHIIPGTSELEGFYPEGIFASNYAAQPFIYIVYSCINVFIAGFVYSLFGMASSILTNKKISALLIPLILYMGINMFTNFTLENQYSSFTTVFPWMDGRTTILGIYGELLAIFIISIVIIKVMQRRDAYY